MIFILVLLVKSTAPLGRMYVVGARFANDRFCPSCYVR